MNFSRKDLERHLLGLPAAIVLVAASLFLLSLPMVLGNQLSYARFAPSGVMAALALMILIRYRQRQRSRADEVNLKRALSVAAESSRSGDPESIIVQGACRFPGVEGAYLYAEAVGSNHVEPLVIAAAGDPAPEMERVLQAFRKKKAPGGLICFHIPSWPSSPQYRLLLCVDETLSKTRTEQIESYAQLAGGYLASGTALREYSLAHSRLTELEREMETARKRVLREARSALLGRLVSNIAHELNNPLAAVLGSAQLLRTVGNDASAVSVLEQLESEARRCKEIVDQVTELAADDPSEIRSIDCNRMVEETLNLLLYKLRRGKIEVSKRLAPEPLNVEGNQALMTQAFLNLGHLATDALADTKEPRNLTVETRRTKDGFKIHLRSGQPLVQVKGILQRAGHRLNLWVADAILQEYGGKLDTSALAEGMVSLTVEFTKKAPSPAVGRA